jgi:hypothetical protein
MTGLPAQTRTKLILLAVNRANFQGARSGRTSPRRLAGRRIGRFGKLALVLAADQSTIAATIPRNSRADRKA